MITATICLRYFLKMIKLNFIISSDEKLILMQLQVLRLSVDLTFVRLR